MNLHLLSFLVCIGLAVLVLLLAFLVRPEETTHEPTPAEREALKKLRDAPELTLAQRKRIAEVLAAMNDDGEKLR